MSEKRQNGYLRVMICRWLGSPPTLPSSDLLWDQEASKANPLFTSRPIQSQTTSYPGNSKITRVASRARGSWAESSTLENPRLPDDRPEPRVKDFEVELEEEA